MLGYSSYHNPAAPYGKKRRKNARIPVTMPYEVNYTCGHRIILRWPVDQIESALAEVAALSARPCRDCVTGREGIETP